MTVTLHRPNIFHILYELYGIPDNLHPFIWYNIDFHSELNICCDFSITCIQQEETIFFLTIYIGKTHKLRSVSYDLTRLSNFKWHLKLQVATFLYFSILNIYKRHSITYLLQVFTRRQNVYLQILLFLKSQAGRLQF